MRPKASFESGLKKKKEMETFTPMPRPKKPLSGKLETASRKQKSPERCDKRGRK